jgi:enterochelin esterase-like enzyme
MRRIAKITGAVILSIIVIGIVLFYNVDYVRQSIELFTSNFTGKGWTLRGNLTKKQFYSDSLKENMTVYVYTPPGYDPSKKDKIYPLLCLLHGYPDVDYKGWIQFGRAPQIIDQLIVRKKIQPMIVVFPIAIGVGQYGDSEYIDSINPGTKNAAGANMLSCISDDLPQWIDAKYHTDGEPSHRWIGGVSTGGYGAMNIALQHPIQFGGAISLSGYYNAQDSGYSRPCWGYKPTKKQLHDQSPAQYVLDSSNPQWKKSYFYVSYGASERSEYQQEAEDFIKKIQEIGAPCTVRIGVGKHSWDQWRQELSEALETLNVEALPKAPSSALNPDQLMK